MRFMSYWELRMESVGFYNLWIIENGNRKFSQTIKDRSY